MRLLHTADIHLGRAYSGLPPQAAADSRDALKRAFRRLIQLVRELEVDALLIAGDLFDDELPSAELVEFAAAQLAPQVVGSAEVYIVPGNHDPAVDGSPYRMGRLPSNVDILVEAQWQRREILGGRAVLWGMAYDRQAEHRRALAELRESLRDEAVPQVVLLHAGLESGQAAQAEYMPFTRGDLSELPVSYVALGHGHTRDRVTSRPEAWYPGPPEFTELRPTVERGGVLLVEIDGDGATSVTPVEVGERTVVSLEVDVASHDGPEAVRSAILPLIGKDAVVRLRLTGPQDPDRLVDVDRLEEALADDCFAALVDDQTTPTADLVAPPGTVKAEFIRRVRDRIESAQPGSDERKTLERALLYGATVLDGKKL